MKSPDARLDFVGEWTLWFNGIIDDGMEAEKHHVFIVSVRLIRSFEYRNIKTVVIKDVHPLQTVREFQTRVEKGANLQCESELQ